MKLKYGTLFMFLFIFILQGCNSSQINETFILEGESEHWKATVTLKLDDYKLQPEHF